MSDSTQTSTTTTNFVSTDSGTSTFITDGYGPQILESIEKHPDLNQIHIIYRRSPEFTWTTSTATVDMDGNFTFPTQPNDKLEKEIWGVDADGKLKLFRVVEGEVIPPAYTTETFKFNDPEGTGHTDKSSSDSEA